MKKRKFFRSLPIYFLGICLGLFTYIHSSKRKEIKDDRTVKKTDHVTSLEKSKSKKKYKRRRSVIAKGLLFFLAYRAVKNVYLHPQKTVQKMHLYRIEKEGSHTSYLYGVAHIQDANFRLPQQVQERAAQTSVLATELDFDKDRDLVEYRNILFKELLRKGRSEELGILKPFLDHVKDYQKRGELHFIYNGYIWLAIKEKGRANYTERLVYQLFQNKERVGLETLKEELGAVGVHYESPQEVGKMEAEMIWNQLLAYRDNEAYRKKMDQSTSLYRKGENLSDQQELSPELTSTLALGKRNQLWIPRMMKAMREQPFFFTVGVLHLPWEEGLLKLLLEERYTVTRIEEDGSERRVRGRRGDYNKPFL